MSWHYLRELAAEYSEGICSAGVASVQLNTTSTQETSYSQDSETGTYQSSQSGMMCEPLTENRGEEWLTLYRAAFHAKTFHQQERGQESKEPEAVCGRKWLELSVRYDPDLHSWKTHRCLFDEDLPQSSVTLPKWGMMRSGVLYRLRTAERPIYENESGLWPTPTVCGNNNRKKLSKTSGDGLATAVMYSTPCARDWKDNGKSPAELERNSQTLATQAGGKLNPTWVEWLMGWPLGWTDCDVLETDKFQSWQQQHGVS